LTTKKTRQNYEIDGKKTSKPEYLIHHFSNLLSEYRGMRITIRQGYYRLVAKELISNTMSEYQAVSRALVKARREGTISYSAIEDRTRSISGYDWGNEGEDEESFIDSAIHSFERALEPEVSFSYSRWYKQPKRVIVLVEKEALAGIFSSVTQRNSVKFGACKGYLSETIKKELYSIIKEYRRQELDVKILYFGDFDPSGRDIPRDIKDALIEMGLSEDDFSLDIIALTVKQIETWKLPPAPTKKTDARSNGFIEKFGDKAVELDAIEPKLLDSLINDAILSHFDSEIRQENVKEAREKREEIQKAVTKAMKERIKEFLRESESED